MSVKLKGKPTCTYKLTQLKALASIETAERRVFGKLVGALDHAVGDLVSALKKKEMWDQTYFIFSSDNGS